MTKSLRTPPPADETSGLPRPPRRRRRALVAALSAALALPLGLAAWAALPAPTDEAAGAAPRGASAHDTMSAAAPVGATPSGKPPVASAPAPQGALNKELATTTVQGFLDLVAAADPKSHRLAAQLSAVARGAIVDEIGNEQQELESNGWTQRGKATVKSVTILSTDLSATPPTAVAQACIDSSHVVTLDASGKPLGGTDPAASRAALNIYSLQQDGGTWRITARTFPDNPAC
jgi:hypothetical protein